MLFPMTCFLVPIAARKEHGESSRDYARSLNIGTCLGLLGEGLLGMKFGSMKRILSRL